MTGAVMKLDPETNRVSLLNDDEMFSLFSDYQNILDAGFP
jgi:hypothetical protein